MADLSVARRCCFRKQFNVPRLPHTDTPWSLALGEQVTFHAFHSLVILCTGPSLSFSSFGYYKFFHFDPPTIVLGGDEIHKYTLSLHLALTSLTPILQQTASWQSDFNEITIFVDVTPRIPY